MRNGQPGLSQSWNAANPLIRRAAVALAIFAIAFMGYYFSGYLGDSRATPWCGGERIEPGCWYQHYIYLADAITHGSLDVKEAGLPDFYQDVVKTEDEWFLPFAPGPSLLLVPFVAVWGDDFSQIYFSMFIGAANVAIFWYLLVVLGVSRTTKMLMIPFFAFGTQQFYSATTGTTWFYGHVAAVFFVLWALIFFLKKAPPIVPALMLGGAFLCREATMLAAPAFAYWYLLQRSDSLGEIFGLKIVPDRDTLWKIGSFAVALVPFVIFWFWYNVVRFDGLFDTGYHTVYKQYIGGLPTLYSFYRQHVPPETPHFELFDIRNIPMHLYTILIYPPDYHAESFKFLGLNLPDWDTLRPSKYGTSLVLTSPAFVYAFVARNAVLKQVCWMATLLICVPLFLHYSQGWVQFGYRFMLDFAPFLLILTALGFEAYATPTGRRIQFTLVAVSLIAGVWGRYWANQGGW